jgi:hypothetical protein
LHIKREMRASPRILSTHAWCCRNTIATKRRGVGALDGPMCAQPAHAGECFPGLHRWGRRHADRETTYRGEDRAPNHNAGDREQLEAGPRAQAPDERNQAQRPDNEDSILLVAHYVATTAPSLFLSVNWLLVTAAAPISSRMGVARALQTYRRQLGKFAELIPSGFEIGIRRNGRSGSFLRLRPGHPLANASVGLASTQRTPVWALGRLASRVVGLDQAERRNASRLHAGRRRIRASRCSL